MIIKDILYYYSQLHVSAPSFGATFRLNSIFLRRQCIQLAIENWVQPEDGPERSRNM